MNSNNKSVWETAYCSRDPVMDSGEKKFNSGTWEGKE